MRLSTFTLSTSEQWKKWVESWRMDKSAGCYNVQPSLYWNIFAPWFHINWLAHWLSNPFYIIKMLDCLVGEIFNESGTKRFQSWWGNCHTPRIPMVQSSREWLPGMVGTLTNMCQVPIELLPTRTRLQTSGKHGEYWRWVGCPCFWALYLKEGEEQKRPVL